jgi:hypothetical protein
MTTIGYKARRIAELGGATLLAEAEVRARQVEDLREGDVIPRVKIGQCILLLLLLHHRRRRIIMS